MKGRAVSRSWPPSPVCGNLAYKSPLSACKELDNFGYCTPDWRHQLKTRAAVYAVLLAATGVAAGGCAVVQERTIGESIDDTSAGTQIETVLFANGGVSKFGEVDVEVADRLALLVGRVPTEADRAEAERLAWTISAIDEVANELVVANRDFVRDINDPWIAARVRGRLLGDSSIKGVNYNIHVFDGTVYLLGFAQNEEELRAAAQHASVIRGVKKVVSYVKLRDRIVPPSQTAQVPGAQPVSEDEQAPAPVVAPERQPTTRGNYSDPYAGAEAQQPASNGPTRLTGSPLPPVEGEFQ